LTSAILVALCSLSPLAGAQTAPDGAAPDQTTTGTTTAASTTGKPDEKTQEMGEISVTGYAQSVEKAIEIKRDTVGQVDAIMAEDIGKFPDQNLAESLQRIPGVEIVREGGEGRQISVRGLSPEFVRIRLNGMEALSTTGENDNSGGNNRGRSFDFNVFAPNCSTRSSCARPTRPTSAKARSARPSTSRPRGHSTSTASSRPPMSPADTTNTRTRPTTRRRI
jgi:hypothetical protein